MVRRKVRSTQIVLGLCLIAVVVLLMQGVALAQVSSPDGTPYGAPPALHLGSVTRGEAAVQALAANLPAVARAYGTTGAELAARLRGDHSLAVDRSGRLFYTCNGAPETATTAVEGSTAAALAPLADTFLLHSRAGAARVIYLDFDGGALQGIAWNAYTGRTSITCPAWDTDGNTAVFGEAERIAIQQIWQRVAEDYAPFDVDVTTEQPSGDRITRSTTSDNYYGTRVVISPISKYFGNYGGISYVGIYNRVDSRDYYKPALVFPENLGPYGVKYVAEAIAHEAGHNLGLDHDGTNSGAEYYLGQGSGETGWAPIMGAAYYQNLTQWSKGEYSGANNTEDDLATIVKYGLPYRVDDHGNTHAAATSLGSGATISATGVIGKTGDVDVFSFVAQAGSAGISVVPADLGPNLDIRADVVDVNGNVVSWANPVGSLGAAQTLAIPVAGTYYLRVHGVGEGDPPATGYTNYASLGQYTVSGTTTASANAAPTAVAQATSATGGPAPLIVSFSGAGSSDPDGSIATYSWDFGDGSTGTGATVSHTYTTAGNFVATLTVTDNGSLTDTDTVPVAVTAAAAKIVKVHNIVMSSRSIFSSLRAVAQITIVDANGIAVGGAKVKVSWSGLVSGTSSGTTNSSGLVTLTSSSTGKKGTVVLTVTSVSKSGYSYDPANNVLTTGSITF